MYSIIYLGNPHEILIFHLNCPSQGSYSVELEETWNEAVIHCLCIMIRSIYDFLYMWAKNPARSSSKQRFVMKKFRKIRWNGSIAQKNHFFLAVCTILLCLSSTASTLRSDPCISANQTALDMNSGNKFCILLLPNAQTAFSVLGAHQRVRFLWNF